ncbi:hypothetical protein SMGD1_1994 [Sulfurimonas gotlandica GD1]|uniref:Uncharacterized protein n=1 Tax=Sulfurimonas gotlandica (strain DSM 19862 / JCM 16533 / GD1) TaxID=929558 RepID=B6BJ03_SULGG|nr:hypothetical protein [Sulfurimonas gotlandica]EDZ63641.1 hypothetical protein CBGD1_1261 [Sulfurimonas gotlandica GD1]EHP30517.1 hypothetical protein SMGD1_1994 [Sulfurimonas gotlandica GD1]
MAKISRETILEATIKGLNKAQKKHLKWTNDEEGVSNGAEYVLTTYIAETIGDSEDIGSVYVEEHIKDLYEAVGKKAPKEIEDYSRKGGRADIAIYLKNKNPLAIIEVKNSVKNQEKVMLDITRIKQLLKDEVIEYGIIAFISEFQKPSITQQDVEKMTLDLIKNCRYGIDELQYKYMTDMFHPTEASNDSMWAWSSVAILFSKK